MQLLRRIKSNLTHNLKWASEFIGTHIHLAVRIGVVWIVLTLIELFVIGITDMNTDLEIIAFAIYKVAEALFLLFCVEQFTKLMRAAVSPKMLCPPNWTPQNCLDLSAATPKH